MTAPAPRAVVRSHLVDALHADLIGEFVKAFGFDVRVVPGFTDRHGAQRAVQERQRR